MTSQFAIFEERFKVQLTLDFEHEPNKDQRFIIRGFLYKLKFKEFVIL